MTQNLQEARTNFAPSLDDVGDAIVALAHDLIKTACSTDDELYHFFQAIAYHVAENKEGLSAQEITEMIRSEMAILKVGGIDDDTVAENTTHHWVRPNSKYLTDTPEESYVLQVLLRHRITLSEDDWADADYHHDPEALKPNAEMILDILHTKLDGNADAAEELDILLKYAPQFRELEELYESVARKHGICVTRSEREWLADKDVEQMINIKKTPVDLSAAFDRYLLNHKIEKLVWKAQTGGSFELGAQMRNFLGVVSDIFFREARETFDELDGLAGELHIFETWLLERASRGVFRTDVMDEIERVWSGREIGRRAGRRTLERFSADGHIASKKKHGKIFFTHST